VAAVGIGWPASGLAAGKMAARVLRGESPAGIPIENIANARVVLNKKQAAKIGLAIPASLKATE
jgi:putative ABC transport system substrate-binding protein